MGYEDNPDSNLRYLKSLSGLELDTYLNGYLSACIHMREALSRGKIEILNLLLDLPEGNVNLEILESHLILLDQYEEIVHLKEQNLLKLFPESTQKLR